MNLKEIEFLKEISDKIKPIIDRSEYKIKELTTDYAPNGAVKIIFELKIHPEPKKKETGV